MISYVRNKRKLEKKLCIMNICFWIVNLAFLEISVNMFIIMISAGTSSWFDTAAKAQVTEDPFFIMHTEMIVKSMIGMMLVIVLFCMITAVLIRNMQLKNMYTQMGMYAVVGYSKKRLFFMCLQEPLADMIIAFPVSIVLSLVMWKYTSRMDTINELLKLLNSSMWCEVLAYIVSALFMLLIIIIHTMYFVNNSIKKGICYMLGKGVI